MKDLIVLGAGNIDIIRLIEDINKEKKLFNFLGFLEKEESLIGSDIFGYPVLGNDELLLNKFSHCAVVNNVMHTPQLHQKVAESIFNKYHLNNTPNLIHPDVDMRFVSTGIGNIIYKKTFLCSDVKIGNFNIFYGGSIGHETVFGNYNLFAGNVVGARCKVGDYNVFGNSSTVTNHTRIGNNNIFGVGSVVMKNVKSDNHLLGYPAIQAEEFMKGYLKYMLGK